jgi:hypothetical protein
MQSMGDMQKLIDKKLSIAVISSEALEALCQG